MDNDFSRFNGEGTLLRKHQIRMLEMLLYIDSVCKANNIQYWLSSGTLLGAVRHGGFIPWDDDVDIEMQYKEYLKLLRLLQNETHSRFTLQTHKNDNGYFFPFAKLRDTYSVLHENGDVDRNFQLQGVYVDIFPLEVNKFPLSKVLGRIQLHIQSIAAYKQDRLGLKKLYASGLFCFMYSVITPLLRLFYKLYTQRVLNHTFGVCFYRSRHTDDLFPLTQLSFEGHMLPVPANCDNYLCRLYGDYMKLPQLDQIEPHTTNVTILD